MYFTQTSDGYHLKDHGGGFDSDLKNHWIDSIASHECTLRTEYLMSPDVKKNYPKTKFIFDLGFKQKLLSSLSGYLIHPVLSFQKFICSFNGSEHVSRKLLVAALHRWRYFNLKTCSKNLQFTVDKLDGHLADYLDPGRHRFYRPFFIGAGSPGFFDEIYSFGHVRDDHASNIYNLEHQLTSSFLHLVSESMATSYYPFVTEKFLYSVVTRGLFLSYAQPGWHDHLERYYGFRKYNKIFDYRFDTVQNPIERLVELMSMIAKFSVLSSDDWRDLYEMEIDTIEHNYDHYFSGNYRRKLFDVE